VTVIEWALAALCVLLFAYVLVRGMSLAYFRTKREYWRAMIREIREGDH